MALSISLANIFNKKKPKSSIDIKGDLRSQHYRHAYAHDTSLQVSVASGAVGFAAGLGAAFIAIAQPEACSTISHGFEAFALGADTQNVMMAGGMAVAALSAAGATLVHQAGNGIRCVSRYLKKHQLKSAQSREANDSMQNLQPTAELSR